MSVKLYLGFMFIFIAGSLAIGDVTDAIRSPETLKKLYEISPWLASNVDILYWVSLCILVIFLAMVPVFIMAKGTRNEENGLEILGGGIIYLAFWIFVCMAIISVGYLVGIGWIAATK